LCQKARMTEITLSPKSRPLGKSGLSVSPMAWGMWRFAGNDVRAARERVEAALDAGMTLLDTADIYGPDNDEPFGASELLLGKVLAEAPGLRDRMVLASKGGIRMGVPYDSSPAYLVEAVDASLARLGVERIDLWQIHRPDMLAHPARNRAHARRPRQGRQDRRHRRVEPHARADRRARRAHEPAARQHPARIFPARHRTAVRRRARSGDGQ
jgi:aryl-alcohol dehydrogenase-like predicted oxidoreductase